MFKNFIEILKKYLEKNNKVAIGYSDEEIKKIEKLYDIEIKGDFREFLKIAGRSDGGLIGGIVFNYDNKGASNQLRRQRFLKGILAGNYEYNSYIGSKPFLIGIELETNYYYIKTNDNDLRMYQYSEGIDIEKCLKINFNEYMISLVEEYNPNLEVITEIDYIGELLIENDFSTDNQEGSEQINFELEEKTCNNKKYIFELEKYLMKNGKKAIGYSEKEIELIEKFYGVKIKGDFKEFMKFAGRSDGGFIGDNPIILYKNWGIQKFINLMEIFADYLTENEIENAGYAWDAFIFSIEDKGQFYFLSKECKKVYHYDSKANIVKDTGMDFNKYMLDLVKRCNPDYKTGKESKGELIKVVLTEKKQEQKIKDEKQENKDEKLDEILIKKPKKTIEETFDGIRNWLLPLLRKDDKIIFPKEEFLKRIKLFDEAEKLRTFNVIKSAVEHDGYCVKFEEGKSIEGYEVKKIFGEMLGIVVEEEVVEKVEEKEVEMEKEKKLTPQQLRKKKFLERMKKSEEGK